MSAALHHLLRSAHRCELRKSAIPLAPRSVAPKRPFSPGGRRAGRLGLGPGVRPGPELGPGSAARFEARLAQVRVDDRVEEGEGVLVLDTVRVGGRVRVTLTLP